MLCLASPLQAIGAGENPVGNAGEVAAAAQQANSPNVVVNPADVIIHGAHLPPINNYGQELLAFNTLVGKDLGILHWYMGWAFTPNAWQWLPNQLNAQVPEDRLPQMMITWIPEGRNCRVTPPDQQDTTGQITSLYDIADGHCDSYVRLIARKLKALPFTFLLRFAHEMNIQDQSWWVGHYNSDPQLYINAYRRLHDVFASEGVTNVQWVWSPCVNSWPEDEWNSIDNYYPGDEYVDWIGLSAFNYAKWHSWPWWSLTDMFDSDMWHHALPTMQCHHAKPILLEIASVEGTRPTDGTKAAWILDAYQKVDLYPFVKAVVWYNDYDYGNPSAADFRIAGGSSAESDPFHEGYAFSLPSGTGSWTNAYRTAVARDKYVSQAPLLEDITPPATLCGGEPTVEVPSAVLAAPGETATFRLSAVGLPTTADVLLTALPPGVTSQMSQEYLLAPWDATQIQLQLSSDAPLGPHTFNLRLDYGSGVYEKLVTVAIVNEVHRVLLPFVSITN